ncbi:MAG TPA: PKD domain-containing protein [Geothrix sp.]|nr:PKD domain-containing protein [Geothrix sp.]
MNSRHSSAMYQVLRLAALSLVLVLGGSALLAEGPNDPAPFINPTSPANGKKVLFDNAHASTAGAADWVINGGFSHMANALAAKGYYVQELRKLPPISYNDLNGWDVLVMAECNFPFKTSEQVALLQFVQNGGSILFIADHYNADRNKNRWDGSEVFNGYRRGAWTNPAKGMTTGEAASYLMQGVSSSDWLATNFGIRFRYNALDNAIPTDIVTPSQAFNITTGVTSFALHAGSTLAILDPTKAKGIVYVPTTVTKWASAVDQGVYNGGGRAEGPYVAISKVGLGKAAFIGDSSPVENTGTKYLKEETGGTKTTYAGWEEANDAILIPQLVDWLANHESYTALDQVPGLQLDTPTPLLAMEDPASSTEPQAEPWATPSAGYLWYDFSTFKAGSYGAGTIMPKNLVTATMSAPAADLTVNSGASLAFTGSATDTSSAATLAYKWTFGDGATATGTSASHAYTNVGSTQAVYTATFTATDNAGYVGVATRVIRVNPGTPQTYTLTASAGANGVITPSGTTTVNSGANQIYTISPNAGYTISSVLVDSVSQGAITTYTFSNVAANHTISASFAAIPTYVVTASAGANGTISPSGSVSVTAGASQTFSITPNSGYAVSAVTVDGVNQGAITSYTFTNVSSAHTISASFAAVITKYVITASAGANGTISPSGSVSVTAGASQTFTITPNAGYAVSSVTVDGLNKGALTSYTFTNVSAAHTISASFAAAVAHTLSENFDTGTKTAYATGTVTFATGTWTLNDALLGSSSQDPHNGVQSVRVRNSGKVTMGFNFAYGAQTVSVKHAVFGTDAASTWGLWYSTNSGSTWTQAGGTITTSSSTLNTATFTLNKTGTIRFEIRKTDGSSNRLNFDDFKVVGY